MKKIIFPKDFLWGGASWATGSEGYRYIDGKSPDVWDDWFNREPYRFFNQNGPDNTLNIYKDYENYINQLVKLNHNSHRFSISWSRFIPNGTGDINPEAVTYYKNFISALKENGIQPIICLWHFDLPLCMAKIGGFESKEVVSYFVDYCKKVIDIFANDVAYFLVLNEVGVLPQGGYLYDFQPPNKIDFKASLQVGYNLLLAQANVVNYYHNQNCPGKIGTILNPNPVYPKDNEKDNVDAAKFLDMIRERFYLDVSVKGELPNDWIDFCTTHNLLPEISEEELEILKQGTVDFLGVNYYQPCRVQAPIEGFVPSWYPKSDKMVASHKKPSKNQIMPENFYSIYDMPGKIINHSRGWEIYPKGIYDTLMRLKNDYNNIPCYIGENGMGVENEEQFIKNGTVQDDYRIKFHKEHLLWLHKAIEEGSNCFGYHVWSPTDIWSPVNAFKNRYGLVRFDLSTKTYSIKKSGLWFSELCKSSSLTIE